MRSDPPSSDVLLRRALQVLFLGLAVYLAIAAYYGSVVGQTMRKAEASKPYPDIHRSHPIRLGI